MRNKSVLQRRYPPAHVWSLAGRRNEGSLQTPQYWERIPTWGKAVKPRHSRSPGPQQALSCTSLVQSPVPD